MTARDDTRRRRVEELFQEALDRPEADRDAFLIEACGDEAELLAEARDLLGHHAAVDESYLTSPLPLPAESLPLGTEIGPYRLSEVLGEGGMGTVYLAEQAEPIQRRVALKLIRSDLDSREVFARFEAERQALALMEHPGIAQVLDAGARPDGRPYFVMEYVAGAPLTEYCDARRLDVDARVRLFLRVCDPVQHAHQKGVIHRDLKPSNVLVTDEAGEPLPKIIDFGVAKATGPHVALGSQRTAFGQVLGTPEYMSPEQTRRGGEDVDTRTDVYSLGMLLYLLLVGSLPFDVDARDDPDLESVLRRIRHDEPTRPSRRVGENGGEVAAQRRTTPERLRRRLRGELDWIVMKALEKERDRRYASVSELAEDLRRFLRDDPVLARPPSRGYRLRKFARRNRAGVAFAAVIAGLLISFVGFAGVQSRRIARERDRANDEAATAREVSQFLFDVFRIADPSEARGRAVTAREVLERGKTQVEERLGDRPVVQSNFLEALGRVSQNLGLLADADFLLARALELRRRELGPDDARTLQTLAQLGHVRWRAGKPQEAEAFLREAIGGYERSGTPDGSAVSVTRNSLGLALADQARFDEAEAVLREALSEQQMALGPDDLHRLNTANSLGTVLLRQGKYEEAEALFTEVLAARRRLLGDDHPGTLGALDNQAHVLAERGRTEDAEALWRRVLAGRREVLGPEHPETLLTMNNLATVVDDLEEQGRLQEEALAISQRVLGPDHPETLASMQNLATFALHTGDLDRAERLTQHVVDRQRELLGASHPSTLSSLQTLAVIARARGDYERAEPYFLEVFEARSRELGPDHPNSLRTASSLGILYEKMGRRDEAERFLRLAADGRRAVLGEEHPDAVRSRERLAAFLAGGD